MCQWKSFEEIGEWSNPAKLYYLEPIRILWQFWKNLLSTFLMCGSHRGFEDICENLNMIAWMARNIFSVKNASCALCVERLHYKVHACTCVLHAAFSGHLYYCEDFYIWRLLFYEYRLRHRQIWAVYQSRACYQCLLWVLCCKSTYRCYGEQWVNLGALFTLLPVVPLFYCTIISGFRLLFQHFSNNACIGTACANKLESADRFRCFWIIYILYRD